jgi:hypothetical protein
MLVRNIPYAADYRIQDFFDLRFHKHSVERLGFRRRQMATLRVRHFNYATRTQSGVPIARRLISDAWSVCA